MPAKTITTQVTPAAKKAVRAFVEAANATPKISAKKPAAYLAEEAAEAARRKAEHEAHVSAKKPAAKELPLKEERKLDAKKRTPAESAARKAVLAREAELAAKKLPAVVAKGLPGKATVLKTSKEYLEQFPDPTDIAEMEANKPAVSAVAAAKAAVPVSKAQAAKDALAKAAKENAKVERTLSDLKIIETEAKKAAKAAAKTKPTPSPAPAPEARKIVAPATPALDSAAQAKPPAKLANEVVNDVTPAIVCRKRSQSYTCIRLQIGATHTHYIALADLCVKKAPNREFHTEWEEYPEYPVRRAAELYLQTPHREVEPQARRHLEAIVADPTTVYNLDAIITQPQSKEPTMATAKKTVAATPAVAPTTAAKKAPAAKTPATPVAPAAKKAPAKTAAPAAAPAKTAAPAAKKAAPNGIATVVNGAKPPAKQAAAAAKPAVAGRPANDALLVVSDPNVARRGTTAEFQDGALELMKASKNKGFTRQQLVDLMVSKGHEVGAAKIKVADMVYFKILAAA